MARPHCQSRDFLEQLPEYDIYFTTKSYGVKELERLGCPKVKFIGNAFDPHTHRPIPVTDLIRQQFGGPVGFVGTYEKERAELMLSLAQEDIPVRIWGSSWQDCGIKHRNLKIENMPIEGDDYAAAVSAFDINLCFLRKQNRDLQTQRSVEIPACGGFMLAERTAEHCALFEEGKEAEYFSSPEELLDKVKYYLAHPLARRGIAAAGRERCLKSGYSYPARVKEMLRIVQEEKFRS
jgi:spore maturation protein CgeB